MRIGIAISLILALSACEMTLPGEKSAPRPKPEVNKTTTTNVSARSFVGVVERMEPVAERMCRSRAPKANCDFQIVVDTRKGQPPNAYQTEDKQGRPIIAFTVGLIAQAQNVDELAFVLGHEAAHHISGHLSRTRDTAVAGAMLGGILATLAGAGAKAIGTAQDLGATVGARTYSKNFELEADSLGTEIAFRAGYNPERGAQFFTRIPDPGDRFLGSHPPNASRIQTVRTTLARLR